MEQTKKQQRLSELSEKAMAAAAKQFEQIDYIAEKNTCKVLDAFRNHRVSETFFSGSTGYGYGDKGRESLDEIYAEIFGTEAAIVRIGFVNGTHALATAIFAPLAPGDTMLSVSGAPYDTLQNSIGMKDARYGSLCYYGVKYSQVELNEKGELDYPKIEEALKDSSVKEVFVQRSRGYSIRPTIPVDEIGKLCGFVHERRPDACVVVDNCYGEFVELKEPSDVGADLIAGSLIKNPGGGLAPTGGYVAGRKDLVEAAAERLTAPGIGGECGATLGMNRYLYQGLFMAPHTVAQALKTAVYASAVFEQMGYRVLPGPNEVRHDIIQMIELGSPEMMKRFCEGIQQGAPVDSFVVPEPWAMPGYDDNVIMAAGAFIQGASIELSADGPIREPYTIYLQGGLTFESGKIGIQRAAELLME